MSKFRAAPRLQSEAAFIQAAEAPRKPIQAAKAPAPEPLKAELIATPTPVEVPVQVETEATKPVLIEMPSAEQLDKPWTQHEVSAKKVVNTQPLRLNDYQYEQLKWLAESEDRSLSQIIRRLFGPALEQAVQEAQS